MIKSKTIQLFQHASVNVSDASIQYMILRRIIKEFRRKAAKQSPNAVRGIAKKWMSCWNFSFTGLNWRNIMPRDGGPEVFKSFEDN